MGTKPSEEELFDSIIDPKDHKVIKYMLKSIGEDIYDKTKSLGRKIKSGATHILNAPLRVFRGYTKGYLNQEDALPTGAINATIAFLTLYTDYMSKYGYVEDISKISEVRQLQNDPAVVIPLVVKIFGSMTAVFLLPRITSYINSKHKEAIEVVYGTSVDTPTKNTIL